MPLDYLLQEPIIEQRGGCRVRLSDDARKCVVFLGFPGDALGDFSTEGTGFFISYGSPSEHYLVTCGHVAEMFKDCPWGIRYNTHEGRADVEHIDGATWVFHPEYPHVDIAVAQMEWPSDADGVCFPERQFADAIRMDSKDFGAGDQVYVAGLFHLLEGKARNLTFLHTGHLSILPGDERIPVLEWREEVLGKLPDKAPHPIVDVEGYVVEVTTLPGSSGSPVFIRRSVATRSTVKADGKPVELKTWLYGTPWLLGVWHGAWDGVPGILASQIVPEGAKVPIGLGVVSPATRLIEVLEMDDFKQPREQQKARKDRARAASPQSAHPTTEGNPRHKEDFNSLLDAAVRKPRRDD